MRKIKETEGKTNLTRRNIGRGVRNPIEQKGLPKQGGRKRDPSRDAEILNAALEVLAEEGYDGMTTDMVALRARAGKGAMYRRWSSKADLILEAVAQMKRNMVDLNRLPDTGTLRSDLLGLFKPQPLGEAEKRLKIMAGLTSMLSQNRSFAEAVNAAVVDPWTEAYSILMKRALERGEILQSIDIETASQIIPSMAAYRSMILRKPFDRKFLVSMIDGVLLPALGIKTK